MSRNKSPKSTSTKAASSLGISNPITADIESIPESRRRSYTMDHDNRRSPPSPLKLRGSYHHINSPSPLKRLPSYPVPPIAMYDSSDEPSPGTPYSDNETSYSRGIKGFERVRSESEETARMLLPTNASPSNRISAEEDTLTEAIPISSSPPKLRLSFESNITEAGSVYDLDTPPNHRVSLKSVFNKAPKSEKKASSPERILTSPPKPNNNADQPIRPPTSASPVGTAPTQLRRQSAVYKKRMSIEVTENTASIKSGKSTIDSPEDRDSGFHEDFDESLRSKQPTPDKQTSYNEKAETTATHTKMVTFSPRRKDNTTTPERAPLMSSDERLTPITLTDPGSKPKKVTLPEIGKMEKFKETFSTNLFENTISPDAPRQSQAQLLSPKPIVAKGKVVTPAEFERLRQQAEDESDDEEEEEDLTRDETYQVNLARQRQRQQAALSIYRQQMTKVVGATPSPTFPSQRPPSDIPQIPEVDEEADEIPLGILMAHGFPQSRPASVNSRHQSVVLEPKRTPSPANLPVFAKNLPADPHVMARSHSAMDLRPGTAMSMANIPVAGRTNSAPAIPLLQTYQTRQRKGAAFMDPSLANVGPVSPVMTPTMPDPSYFSPVPGHYEVMGMQPVPGQGMVQYVPVMVTPPMGSPSLGVMQPPTLMQDLQTRQQLAAQHRSMTRMSQMNLANLYQQQQMQQMQPQQPQQIIAPQPRQPVPQLPVIRPPSIYHDAHRSTYDQKSIYSTASQQPMARPKLPSTNPAYRLSTASSGTSGRYRASTYGVSGLGVTDSLTPHVPVIPIGTDDDEGWDSLRRKKMEMQARRMSRMPAVA